MYYIHMGNYTPNDLEDKILRIFHEQTRKRGKKSTPTGLAMDVRRVHKELEREEIEEAIEILCSQKYLDKKTESHKHDPSLYNRFSKQKPYTIKTTYVMLSGKGLLYLKNRPLGTASNSASVFDSESPYSVRRKLEVIFEEAKTSISIVDNYMGRKTLDLLVTGSVPVRVITSSKLEEKFDTALKDFESQYKSTIEIKYIDGVFHGRFILADEKCFVLDHSIKDFGSKPSAIIEIQDPEVTKTYQQLFDRHWE